MKVSQARPGGLLVLHCGRAAGVPALGLAGVTVRLGALPRAPTDFHFARAPGPCVLAKLEQRMTSRAREQDDQGVQAQTRDSGVPASPT